MNPDPRPVTHRWADLSARDFQQLDAAAAVAVLPVAAIEQHGPHLPLGVDAILAEGLVAATIARLAPDSRALFLPVQSVGKSDEHGRFAGTLSLSAETLVALWTQIGASVAATGVRRFVFFNTHGGNVSAMDIVGRDLRARFDMAVFTTNWFSLGLPEGIGDADELRFGVHGGELETAMMLALAPQRVDMTRAEDFASARRRHARDFPLLGNGTAARFSWMAQDLNPSGVAGNAKAATAATGRAVVAHVAERFAALLAEVERFPLSELRERPGLL